MPLVAGLFFFLFAAVGALASVAIAVDWVRGLKSHFWQPATCVIERSEVVPRPEYGDTLFEVRYRYSARGEERTGNTYRHGYDGSESEAEARILASRFPVGIETSCWVDAEDPRRSALLRANLWEGLWIFATLLFVAVGVGGFWLYRNQDRLSEVLPGEGKALGAGKWAVGFFGLFLVFGLLFLIPFFLWPIYRIAEARSWKETPCEILSSGVRTHSGEDNDTYSVEVLYRYKIGDREYLSDRYDFLSGSSSGYESKARIVESLPPGAVTRCWVDPRDPAEAVVDRGFRPDLLFGLIPLLFVGVGAGGVAFSLWSSRAARRAAERPTWIQSTPKREAGMLELEPTVGPLGRLAVAGFFTLVWNGLVAVFVWQLVQSWREGHIDWFLALFLTPFVLVGLLIATGVPYSALALLNPRPRLRLSRLPLRPGGSAQVEWSFRGATGRIERLTLRLVGSRQREGKQGGDDPFESLEIVDRQRGFGLEYGTASVELPDNALPSGGEGGRRVVWKLQLHASIPFWPDVKDEFEVEVLPPAERGSH